MFLHDYLLACEISTVRTQTLSQVYVHIILYKECQITFNLNYLWCINILPHSSQPKILQFWRGGYNMNLSIYYLQCDESKLKRKKSDIVF